MADDDGRRVKVPVDDPWQHIARPLRSPSTPKERYLGICKIGCVRQRFLLSQQDMIEESRQVAVDDPGLTAAL